ncbi:magnesium transporter [Actinomycetospora lutea]|uniref:magnesium transporter n=1 Tax=Actinomycetospora lutea TaxID=663604 RepID=UPI002366B923|nr:magnesium transporter [Actinomycetospora lutea]MDD7940593.1 magnesium transporter [Actinomycetospora lutea]
MSEHAAPRPAGAVPTRGADVATTTSAPVGGTGTRTAEDHVSVAVPVTTPDERCGQVLDGMRGRRFESAAAVAVCAADGTLVGMVTVERLLASAGETPIRDVMDPEPPTVTPATDQEQAAWRAVHRGESVLPVVDPGGRFRGFIPPDRLLAVLLTEHDEDVARLGGFLGSSSEARSAALESVGRRMWHRLPWLLVGLVGAFVAAGIVGAFEHQLEEQVLIAFFLPGVVYLADAVGTQTEALVIRGLAAGVPTGRIAFREAVTGPLLGVLFAAVTFPVVLLLWGDPRVAAAVAVALFAASSIATVVALALPSLLHRLGRDPAFGSGPLATVVQDLLSIVIYFLAATAIVT